MLSDYFLLDMIVATRMPKAIINDNASYVLILPPPLKTQEGKSRFSHQTIPSALL